MTPATTLPVTSDPLQRACTRLYETLNHDPTPPSLPNRSHFAALQDTAYQICKMLLSKWSLTEGTLILTLPFVPPAPLLFRQLLLQFKQRDRKFRVIFTEEALRCFTPEMLDQWKQTLGTLVYSIKFRNKTESANKIFFEILRTTTILEELDLSECIGFNYQEWRAIPSRGNLRRCNLNFCTSVAVETLLGFSKHSHLLSLSLQALEIGLSVFKALLNAPAIQILNLEQCILPELDSPELNELPESGLTSLSVRACQLSSTGFVAVFNCFIRLRELDISETEGLTAPAITYLLNSSNLQVLRLAYCPAVNEELFTPSSLTSCNLHRLDLSGSQLKGTTLKGVVTHLTTLMQLDVEHCPELQDEDITAIQQMRPLLDISRNRAHSAAPNERPALGTSLTVFLNCLFPNTSSQAFFDKEKNLWTIQLAPFPDLSSFQWGKELPVLIAHLKKSQVRLDIRTNRTLTPQNAPAFISLINALSPILTELHVFCEKEELFLPSFLPKLEMLEIRGGHLREAHLDALRVPSLSSLTLEKVEIAEDALHLLPVKLQDIKSYVLKTLPTSFNWNLLAIFAALPRIQHCAFEFPQAVQDNLSTTQAIEICFALWANTYERERSREIAKQLAPKVTVGIFSQGLALLIRATKLEFEPFIDSALKCWNNQLGHLLPLVRTATGLKATLSLPISPNLEIDQETHRNIVNLFSTLPIQLWIEVKQGILLPTTHPESLQKLASTISPYLTSFAWKHCSESPLSPLPVPLCAPFLKSAFALTELSLVKVSFATAGLEELFSKESMPSLLRLRLVQCGSISAAEILSWARFIERLERLSLFDCRFQIGPGLETALGPLVPSLVSFDGSLSSQITDGWIHALSHCKKMDRLKLAGTGITNGVFDLFDFPLLKTFSCEDTGVTDAGLIKFARKDRQLETLDISRCKIQGFAFERFQLVPLLQRVIWCHASVIPPEGLRLLANAAPLLVSLNLTGSHVPSTRGIQAILSGCEALTDLRFDPTEHTPPFVMDALRPPRLQTTQVVIQFSRLTDDQLHLFLARHAKVEQLTLIGCKGVTVGGIEEALKMPNCKTMKTAHLFLNLPGDQVLSAFLHLKELDSLTLQGPLTRLDNLNLASALLTLNGLTKLHLDHRTDDLGEKCPLTKEGVLRILQRKSSSLKTLHLQGMQFELPGETLNDTHLVMGPPSQTSLPWSPRGEG